MFPCCGRGGCNEEGEESAAPGRDLCLGLPQSSRSIVQVPGFLL